MKIDVSIMLSNSSGERICMKKLCAKVDRVFFSRII